jgi:hypothetical protein
LKPSLFYRIAAVLILLFDAGHTSGFPWSDPKWGVDLHVIQSSRFDVLGSGRTYWDFYVGFGLIITVFLLLAAVLAWQLGGLSEESRLRMRGSSWALVLCFGAIAILNWRYFFIIPLVFSIAITACLLAAVLIPGTAGVPPAVTHR